MRVHFYILGSRLDAYLVMGVIGFIVLSLFIFSQMKSGVHGYLELLIKKNRLKLITIILCVVEALLLASVMIAVPSYIVEHPFGSLFEFYGFTNQAGTANYFGLIIFALFCFFAMAFLLGLKPLKTLDSLAPGFPLALIFAKLACFCSGCCNGFQADYGFFNKKTRLTEFPVQLVESAEALVIFIILLLIRKRAKLGTMYPIYLMLYSGMRFCSEFLRAYPDAFGPFKIGHILALALFSLGALETAVALKFGERIDSAFGDFYARIEKKLNVYKKF